jgi:hypothetical protein
LSQLARQLFLADSWERQPECSSDDLPCDWTDSRGTVSSYTAL